MVVVVVVVVVLPSTSWLSGSLLSDPKTVHEREHMMHRQRAAARSSKTSKDGRTLFFAGLLRFLLCVMEEDEEDEEDADISPIPI